MVSAQGYIDKIHTSRDFIFSKRLLRYRTDFPTYADLKKNSESLLTNLCKLVFVLSGIHFEGRSDNEIISYVECNYNFGGYITRYIECYNYWIMFTKRQDQRNRERYLRGIIGYSEVIENEIRSAFGLPLYRDLKTSFDVRGGV